MGEPLQRLSDVLYTHRTLGEPSSLYQQQVDELKPRTAAALKAIKTALAMEGKWCAPPLPIEIVFDAPPESVSVDREWVQIRLQGRPEEHGRRRVVDHLAHGERMHRVYRVTLRYTRGVLQRPGAVP
jgi:hypothetical protein